MRDSVKNVLLHHFHGILWTAGRRFALVFHEILQSSVIYISLAIKYIKWTILRWHEPSVGAF